MRSVPFVCNWLYRASKDIASRDPNPPCASYAWRCMGGVLLENEARVSHIARASNMSLGVALRGASLQSKRKQCVHGAAYISYRHMHVMCNSMKMAM